MKNLSILITLALIFGTAIISCKKKDQSISVTSVKMSQTSKTMEIGDTLQLTATVAPNDATNKNITWSSSTPAVASVLNGRVIALTAGTTNIIATSQDGAKTDTCKITVNQPPLAKTITVGAQNETLTEKQTAAITFPVTTENIPNGTFPITVDNLPTGLTAATNIVMNNHTGTLTLTGSATTVAGTYSNLVLKFGEASSKPFELNILKEPVRTIVVGKQNSVVMAGTASTVTFPVTTTNFTQSNPVAMVLNLPTGVTMLGSFDLYNNPGILSLSVATTAVAGTYSNLRLKLDNDTSAPFELLINPAETRTITVGTQSSPLLTTLAANDAFTAFRITTNNIANGAVPAITWYNSEGTTIVSAPANLGVTIYNVANNVAAITMRNTNNIVAGVYYFKITIDGLTSALATLTVSSFANTTNIIDVGAQHAPVTSGGLKGTDFTVTTKGIDNNNQFQLLWFSDSLGLVTTSAPAGTQNISYSNPTFNGTHYSRILGMPLTNPVKGTIYFRIRHNPTNTVSYNLQKLVVD